MRKGKPAAHRIFGPSETCNRAYLKLMEMFVRCSAENPALLPVVLHHVTAIHRGQDDALVWRRDRRLPATCAEALRKYKQISDDVTGSLFRLCGQLVTWGSTTHDQQLTLLGWQAHLQNDCKNLFSSDYFESKGAAAEDVLNGDLTYPILLAYYHGAGTDIDLLAATSTPRTSRNPRFSRALDRVHGVLQQEDVKGACLRELDAVTEKITALVDAWGRKERMV